MSGCSQLLEWCDSVFASSEACDVAVDMYDQQCCRNLAALFSCPHVAFMRYGRDDLVQGYSRMSDAEGMVVRLISCHRIPWPVRRRLIESVVSLYERQFAIDALDHVCFMWWDGIVGYGALDLWCCRTEKRKIIATIVSALEVILRMKNADCIRSALHGLAHVPHRRAPSIIRASVRANNRWPEALKEYARQCLERKVL